MANSPPEKAKDLRQELYDRLVHPTARHLPPAGAVQGQFSVASPRLMATPLLSFTGDSGKLGWECEPNDPAEAVDVQGAHTDSSVLGPCSSRPFSQRSAEEMRDPTRRKRHPNRDDPGDGEEI